MRTPTRTAEHLTLERHYSIKDAATVIGVPPSTLRTWVLEGRLPRIKVPTPGGRGRVLLRESDLAAFLDECRVPAAVEVMDRALGYVHPPRGRPSRPA